MQLKEAVSKRLLELLSDYGMSQYQLYINSGVSKSTIGNLVNCTYDSVKLRILHEICQGFGITTSISMVALDLYWIKFLEAYKMDSSDHSLRSYLLHSLLAP